MGRQIKLRARLTVANTVRPILSFQFNAPERALGASLSVRLADRTEVIADDALVTFELGVESNGNVSWAKYVDGGMIAGRKATVRVDDDTLTVNAVDYLSDKWDLAPRNPFTLYDPEKFDPEKERTQSSTDVVTFADNIDLELNEERNYVVRHYLVSVPMLDLHQVLQRAYVDGCEFTEVITNIPNYRVRSASFPLSTSYHSAASQFIALFEPVVFADDAGRMYILDAQRPLPAGYSALVKKVGLGKQVASSQDQPMEKLYNAVLLTYETDDWNNNNWNTKIEWPPTSTIRIDEDSVETGTYGTLGYAVVRHLQSIREFHDDSEHPTRVTREVPFIIETYTYAWDEDANGIGVGDLVLLHYESQEDNYDKQFRVKLGYTKSVQALVLMPNTGSEKIFMEVLNETSLIKWKASVQNPDVMVKQWSYVYSEGLVLVEGDGSDPNSIISKLPLVDAARNRSVVEDGTQTVMSSPLNLVMEWWRDTGQQQVDIHIVKIDYLLPQIETSVTKQHIADRTINTALNRNNVVNKRTVTELITDQDSEELYGKRTPVQVNAGPVPYSIAKPIAQRKLKRSGSIPKTVDWELPNFDANLQRGSLRQISTRTADGDIFIVTSYRIVGANLGSSEGGISQSAHGMVVKE